MADNIQTVVQRMVAAGESEDNIAAVIQHAKTLAAFNPEQSRQTLARANQQPLPPTPTLGDEFTPQKMGDRALSGLKGEAEGFAGGIAAPVAALGYGVLHPVDAAKGAAVGVAGAGAVAADAVTHPSQTWDAAKHVAMTIASDPEHIGQVAGGLDAALATPSLLKVASGTRLGSAVSAGVSDAANKIPGVRAARAAWASAAPAAEAPTVAAPTSGTLRMAPAETAAPSGLSAADRASLVRQGFPEAAIAKIEAQLAPAVSHTPAPVVAPVPSHPLTAPRVDVGAEAVGKAEGLTKQAVRDATGPIYGEQPGEAAPVFPESAYQRMAEKMRAMHPNPGDPSGDATAWDARLNYANQSRDPKSLSQLVSMMRAWRDVHMAVPAAAGAGLTVNALVRKRLQEGTPQP